MRKILAVSAVALTSILFTGSAFAQTAPAPAPAPAAPAEGGGGDDGKKIGVGIEAAFLLPLGDLGDFTGPLVGPLVRFGYKVTPALELQLRTGYLFGLSKETGPVKSSLSIIPVWAGVRYYFMEPGAGLYGLGELALNLGSAKAEVTFAGKSVEASNSATRLGFNIGAGYVISKELPINIQAQFSMINLLLKEDAGNVSEPTQFALGIMAGYTFQF